MTLDRIERRVDVGFHAAKKLDVGHPSQRLNPGLKGETWAPGLCGVFEGQRLVSF
jgi:hypothetical protein